MNQRVASIPDTDRLLPSNVAQTMPDGLEPVFMVTVHDDGTESIVGGEIIDTFNDLYCTFALVTDETGKADVLATTDWLPLPDPEEAV